MTKNSTNEPPEWFLIAMLLLGIAFVIGLCFGIIITWQSVAEHSAQCNWILGYMEALNVTG